jgi:chorismate lyase / 3-hydroxybenzoate synthase
MTTSDFAADSRSPTLNAAAPRMAYHLVPASRELPRDVLFAVTFGTSPRLDAPASAHVNLDAATSGDLAELWFARGPVKSGYAGPVRYSADPGFLAGVIEVDEGAHGGIEGAAEHAYRTIAVFQSQSTYPHLLRVWNYFDAINGGEGESERYRLFCSGRVAGFADAAVSRYPAATVIGRRDGQPMLLVYWLAARAPGEPLENPRQLPAYQYPLQYGRTSPTFSRAMLVAPDTLMISGTASIVGHASQHPGDVGRQVTVILENLEVLIARAHAKSPALPARIGRGTAIKAYVRNSGDVAEVESRLRARLPNDADVLVLSGDVCRADLLVEFDCVHTAG